MTIAVSASRRESSWPPLTMRVLLIVVMSVAILGAAFATDAQSAAQAARDAGADLTRLLRAMAALKAIIAAGAIAAVLWRLGSAVTPLWFAAYATASAAMAAGPALIWSMAHVGLGAVLLHGGLLAAILLLWRDKVTGMRLQAVITARRAALRR